MDNNYNDNDDDNKQFAAELISIYGEDRFYHCSMSGGFLQTRRIFKWLSGLNADFDKIVQKYNLQCLAVEKPFPFRKDDLLSKEQARSEMCRIVFGFCKNYKKFGLINKKPPANIQARMILGDKNEWVEKYAELMKEYDG